MPQPMLTSTDRIIAVAAAAYLAYRLWSGWGGGVIYGDGDNDVHAGEDPTAFVATALSVIAVIIILGIMALDSSVGDLAAMIAWLWKA